MPGTAVLNRGLEAPRREVCVKIDYPAAHQVGDEDIGYEFGRKVDCFIAAAELRSANGLEWRLRLFMQGLRPPR
jgi:hypothetical protein